MPMSGMQERKNLAEASYWCYTTYRIVAWLYSYTEKEMDLVMASRSAGAAEARVSSFTSLEEEMCQGRCIHPEHVRAVRQNLLSTDKATRIANLFAVLSDP